MVDITINLRKENGRGIKHIRVFGVDGYMSLTLMGPKGGYKGMIPLDEGDRRDLVEALQELVYSP